MRVAPPTTPSTSATSSLLERWTPRVLAGVLAAAALFHAWRIVAPDPAEDMSPARHALFVAVNAACAIGFLARPRGFVLFFAALTVQQLYSHGLDAWLAWSRRGEIDVRSLGVLVVMPAALAYLAARTRRDRDARAA